MTRYTAGLLIILTASSMLSACSWVKITESGKRVTLNYYEQVTNCQKLGYTRSVVLDKIGFFKRNARTMTEELVMLAQNEAALMGGNTIVARGPVKEGEMVFDVYWCQP